MGSVLCQTAPAPLSELLLWLQMMAFRQFLTVFNKTRLERERLEFICWLMVLGFKSEVLLWSYGWSDWSAKFEISWMTSDRNISVNSCPIKTFEDGISKRLIWTFQNSDVWFLEVDGWKVMATRVKSKFRRVFGVFLGSSCSIWLIRWVLIN